MDTRAGADFDNDFSTFRSGPSRAVTQMEVVGGLVVEGE